MAGYAEKSRYVDGIFALTRIADHHFQGNKVAAHKDLSHAMDEGALTRRRRGFDEMLSRSSSQGPEFVRGELEKIYGHIFGEDEKNIFPGNKKPKSGASPRPRGRGKGVGSYEDADAPLVEKMHKLIKKKVASGPHQAAKMVAERAEGKNTTFNSKVRRLLGRYSQRYP